MFNDMCIALYVCMALKIKKKKQKKQFKANKPIIQIQYFYVNCMVVLVTSGIFFSFHSHHCKLGVFSF